MATRTAWVLNLDADLEFGAGAGYTPKKSVRLAMKTHIARLAASLLGPGDVLVEDATSSAGASGLPGRAFCPTPRAVALLEAAGAIPEAHPRFEVLRRVNSRAFASALGTTLEGAEFVTDLARAQAKVRTAPPVGEAWRAKGAFGMTGRNQRVISPAAQDAADLDFLERAVVGGGAQIEPDVAIADEYAIHGMLSADGALRAGRLVRQHCDARGAWLATERIPTGANLSTDLRERMDAELRRVARALHDAGYFGPFGIDAYEYRDRAGELRLQERSEINARYSMGFSVGMRGSRDQSE